MRTLWGALIAVGLLFAPAGASGGSTAAAESNWVHLGRSGKLVYALTPKGDHIPDFSYAGYEGGGVALPTVPTRLTVAPSATGADDTAAIQSAVDAVSAMPLGVGPGGKFRGAVELKPGTFHCSGTISITASGVVLRGAGNTDKGTTILMTGRPHMALRLAGRREQKEIGTPVAITDAYVPAGAMTFHVTDESAIHAGDELLITKPVTAAWVHFMGMDGMRRDGKDEHWVAASHLDVRRCVTAVAGNTFTLDVPLMDDYDASFFDGGHAMVQKIEVSGQIEQVGVEDLRFLAPKQSIALGAPSYSGGQVRDVVDGWMRSVTWEQTTNGVSINDGSVRITFEQCEMDQDVPVTSSAKPADFAVNGGEILLDRCTGRGDSTFYVVTQAGQQGPVVALHCRFTGNGHIQPHQRWSTGLLIDNCEVPGGGIDMMNRGEMGTGHGWAIGWAVVWNSSAKSFQMNTPPGSMIWSIGNRGEEINPPFPVFDGGGPRPALEPAAIESAQKPVKPESLYLEQLKERLGAGAVKNIGY